MTDFMRVLAEASGFDPDAPSDSPPVQGQDALVAPAPTPMTADGYAVAYAYSPREGEGSRGRYHLVTPIAISVGRLQRAPGDPLCKPARKCWGLDDGRTEADFNQYGCTPCRAMRQRLQAKEVL